MPIGLVTVIDKTDTFWRENGSKNGYVHHRGDWKVITFCYDMFRISYPKEAKIFIETQKNLRKDLINQDGSVKEGEARVRHVANIPEKMFALINTFYPKQKWDRKFVFELAKHLPVIQIPKKL